MYSLAGALPKRSSSSQHCLKSVTSLEPTFANMPLCLVTGFALGTASGSSFLGELISKVMGAPEWDIWIP